MLAQVANYQREPRIPKGNRHMRPILNQAANAAVKAKGTIFEIVYRRLVSRLGHYQTIGAIAHRLSHLISDLDYFASGSGLRRARSLGARKDKTKPHESNDPGTPPVGLSSRSAGHSSLSEQDFQPRFSTLPFRAYGPRNFMKIVESQSTMGNTRERRGRTHSGAVEAVTLSDPERA